MAVFLAIQEKRLDLPWGWTLFVGLVSVAAGVMALVYPAATLAALMGLIAAFALVAGALMLVGAAKLHGLKREVQDTIG